MGVSGGGVNLLSFCGAVCLAALPRTQTPGAAAGLDRTGHHVHAFCRPVLADPAQFSRFQSALSRELAGLGRSHSDGRNLAGNVLTHAAVQALAAAQRPAATGGICTPCRSRTLKAKSIPRTSLIPRCGMKSGMSTLAWYMDF